MLGVNASLWTRIEFEVEDPHILDILALRISYEDGFAAYLNGQKVPSRNAPDSIKWDSTALNNRPIEDSSVFEVINLMSYLDLLLPKPQKNVLAIQRLNDNKNDGEFRILSELITAVNRVVPAYFTRPTPGTFNISGAMGAVSDVWFSTKRTFYTGPPDWHIDSTLSNGTDGAEIRYTLDGSRPTITHGLTYDPMTDPPLEIDETTIIRAVAVKPGWLDSKVETHTYIFLDDVIQQPVNPTGFPTSGWGHAGPDYEMDPEVVTVHGTSIKEDLKAVPTLSLAMDVNDWFGTDGQGIYPQGELSERAVSAELIFPDGSEGFQIDCAVMVVGGSSVYRWKMDKLSLRLKFKAEYVPTELRCPVFGDEATDQFDTLVLDARMNNIWAYGGPVMLPYNSRPWISGNPSQRDVAQYTREQFVSDIQNAIGGYGTHGRHVHLYLNGLYWGLYWLHERPDEHFAAEYFGGDDSDYDALKHNSSTVINGSGANYNEMFDIANAGLETNTQYQLIQQYLDVPSFIVYMITNFYVGNTDWAHQNWYATRSRVSPDGRWRYHSWDGEHVMEYLYENVTGKNDSVGPTRLHQRLRQNDEYRLLFADYVHRHFFNDGVLTPEGAVAMYTVRLNEVDRAVVGESARWGDNQIDEYPNIRYMRDPHWLIERDWLLYTYLQQRTDIVLGQLRNAGLYPMSVDAPVFYINGQYQHGGEIEAGDQLTIDNPNTSGSIYYTLEGGDPRQPVSGIPVGTRYTKSITLNKSTHVKARVLDGGTWSALNEAIFAVGPVVINEIMYSPPSGNQNEEYIELYNITGAPVTLYRTDKRTPWKFTDGIDYTFSAASPYVTIPGDGYLMIVKDKPSFIRRYGIMPEGVQVLDGYSGFLSNVGERLQIAMPGDIDEEGTRYYIRIDRVTYSDGLHPEDCPGGVDYWPFMADGYGYSLSRKVPSAYGNDVANWKAAAPSPGLANP